MSESTVNRRSLLMRAALAVATVPAFALTTSLPAMADQGNMEHALRLLGNAMEALRMATPNKGGHRERAIELIESAMGEVQAGIDFADTH